MLDKDLARLYQVQTKVLNQAVKRNINRHLVALQQQVDSRFEALEQKVDNQQQQVEL